MSQPRALTPPDEATEPDYIEVCVQAIQAHEAARTFGRPASLTPPKVRKFLQAIERGNFVEPACYYAGLSYRTVKRWCDEGKADETEASPQWHFWQAVQRAQATDEDQAVSRLQKVASEPRFYMADIIRLSRRHRDRWAERTADELRAATTPQVTVLIGIAPPGTPQNPIQVGAQIASTAAPRALSPSVSEDLHSVSPRVNSV